MSAHAVWIVVGKQIPPQNLIMPNTRTPRNTDAKIVEAKRFIAEGLSQQDVAKKVGVSGWTISQWKIKGKLGELPKGRIPKAEASKALATAAVATKPPTPLFYRATTSELSTIEDLRAENEALKTAVKELKALVPPTALAAYKKAAASVLAALE